MNGKPVLSEEEFYGVRPGIDMEDARFKDSPDSEMARYVFGLVGTLALVQVVDKATSRIRYDLCDITSTHKVSLHHGEALALARLLQSIVG